MNFRQFWQKKRIMKGFLAFFNALPSRNVHIFLIFTILFCAKQRFFSHKKTETKLVSALFRQI